MLDTVSESMCERQRPLFDCVYPRRGLQTNLTRGPCVRILQAFLCASLVSA